MRIKKMHKKVSIVIPMYNESRYIGRCLDSLLNQSYQDFEIILIDDGSKDNTVKIAEWYKNKTDLTILQQKNSGPGKARNRWAKEAKGDIIVLVDADMFFDKDFIKYLVDPILTEKEMGTSHGVEKVGNPENIRSRSRCIDRIVNPPKRQWVYRAIKRDIFLKEWWFDASRWYFDDNLSHINKGKWALTIMNAICYHNNPSTLWEAFKHSTRVGKSFAQNPDMIFTYAKKYTALLSGIFIALVVWAILLCKTGTDIWNTFFTLLILLFGFLEYLAIKRIAKEKERRYLYSIPMLSIARWAWYARGMIRYLFIRR